MHRLLIICLSLQPIMLWAGDSLRLAADEWPPFTGKTHERQIAEDLVTVALRKSGLDVSVSLLPWEEALQAVRLGDFDGLVAAWHTPERERHFLFSIPILENRILAVSLRESGLKIESVEDLRQRVVGKTAGYVYGATLDNAPAARIVSSADDREGLERLLKKELEVLLIDDLSLRYLLQELPAVERDSVQKQAQLVSLEMHFVLRRGERDAVDMMAAFDEAIADMMADGTYNQILDLPWVLVDTDKDGVAEMIPGKQALDLSAPPADGHYEVLQADRELNLTPQRVYLVGGRQYDNWEDARGAIIDKTQSGDGDRMIQDNRYEIGVPF